MRVILGNFGGIIPRVSAHSLGISQASVAHNVKLRNGRLEAWRETCGFASALPSDMSFHIHGCCAVSWGTIVYAADVGPDWGRFYITGRTGEPEQVLLDRECRPTYFKLGVPTPVAPPVASGPESCDRTADDRTYVYTYLNAWGEESAPSPPSNHLTVADGESVLVTGIMPPPDGYGIRYANLYRATTGFRTADGKNQKPMTDYLYVATIEFPTTAFTDRVMLADLSAALDTQKVRMPPAGLTNLVAIEGVLRLAGTVKNRIHITENFQPYNWPVKYDLTLDSNIIHMGALGQKLYVTTDTTPYIIDVSSCEDMKCTPVQDVGVPIPDIACQYASATVMTQHGLIYSSPLGLILIDASAKWHLLTAKWFSEDDWALLKPDTVRLAYWEGFLFCVTDVVAFILNIDGQPYGDMKNAELSTISDKPVDIRRGSTGDLFLLEAGKISVWNHGAQYRPFEWVSAELSDSSATVGQYQTQRTPVGNLWSPVSVKIRTTDTEFSLVTPLQDPAYKRKVLREEPFRLPRVGRHNWYKVRLRGISAVEFVDMGTSNFTVNQGA